MKLSPESPRLGLKNTRKPGEGRRGDEKKTQQGSGLPLPVRFVPPHRGNECGYCKYQCPDPAPKAIVVTAKDALRLNEKSHRQTGRLRSLRICRNRSGGHRYGAPEIFVNSNKDGLSSGFSP
ncbi:MAG: hypothetical protein JXK94_03210 [Deltaproteobacteria bacterium]|nr:hypothetical protein [Deltaproteobacteria bacterium]